MFKKLFNKPQTKNEQERTTTRENRGQVNSSNAFEELPERPFDINLDELWEYEFEELHEFIKHYEQFCNYVRNKYNDLLNEAHFVQEKLGLLDQERRRLVTENEQYKVHNENLKRCLDEKSPSANTTEALTTKSSSQKTEEGPQSPTESDQNEDDAVLLLKNRAEKLLEELKIAQEPICHNIIGQLAEHSHFDNKKSNQVQHTEEEEHENQSEGEQGSRALDTENNEALDSERVNADGVTDRESKEAFEVHLREAVSSSLGQAFKRISKEVGNIFEGYSEVYGKTKQKEKDMIAKIRNEAANKAKNEEYEKELKDLRGKLNEAKNAMNELKSELDNKTKLLEKTKKAYDDTAAGILEERKKYEQIINERQKEIDDLQETVEMFKETTSKDEKVIEELEAERDELFSKLEEIEKEYQLLTKNKDRNEKDVAQEVQKYQKNLQLIEEEKKKNDKKLQRIEADRNDIENSLIQEKLKHHQTIADLTKAKEKIEEVQKNLNEETDARKGDIRKYDELKKRMTELEKKEKENKKTIKNLNEQIESKNKEIQQLEEERQKHLEQSKANADKGSEQDKHEDGVNHEVLQKAEIINTQYEKIHQLEEKLEETVKKMNNTQKSAEQLQKDKEDLVMQVKVLKEKREQGLQEIKRLTKIVDQSKGGDTNMSLSSVQSRTNIDYEKPSAGYFSPVTLTSPTSVASSRLNFDAENVKSLRKIKKGLDEVYKEIIMAITNEKIYESQSDKRPTGKLGELVKGPLPSDNFMKIEKRMNDTIVMLQEFMENFE